MSSLPLFGIPCESTREGQRIRPRRWTLAAWDRSRQSHVLHDDVERADAVCRDKQERIVAAGDRVDVAHFAAREEVQRGALGLSQSRHRV